MGVMWTLTSKTFAFAWIILEAAWGHDRTRDRFENFTKYAQQIAEVENRNVIKLVFISKSGGILCQPSDVKKKFLSFNCFVSSKTFFFKFLVFQELKHYRISLDDWIFFCFVLI